MTETHSPSLLIRGATVLTMDEQLGDIAGGDVLVEGGRISAVGKYLPAGAHQVIEGAGMILMPGLIDTHTHMWQGPIKGLGAGMWGMADYIKHVFALREKFTAADMHDGAYSCGVEMLDNGITTVLDFCHNVMTPGHAEQSLAAHRKTGQRVLFAYGMLGSFATLKEDHAWRLEQVRSLHGAMAAHPPSGNADRVRLGMALGSLEYAGMALFEAEVALARELGMPMTFHQNVAGQLHELHTAGLLGGDMLPVHCNPALDFELDLLAACGAGISFTPESEVGDGRPTSVIARSHRAGVTPSLGVDVPCRVALDLFSQMRLTFWLMRAEEAEAERLAGRWPLTRYSGTPRIQPRHLIEYVTRNAARAVGLGDELGRIAPGCLADLLLLRTGPYCESLGDPAAHVVLQSTIGDVDTVVVAGEVLKRAGQLVGLSRADARAATQRVRARLFA